KRGSADKWRSPWFSVWARNPECHWHSSGEFYSTCGKETASSHAIFGVGSVIHFAFGVFSKVTDLADALVSGAPRPSGKLGFVSFMKGAGSAGGGSRPMESRGAGLPAGRDP